MTCDKFLIYLFVSNGDSGSPLMIQSNEIPSYWMQIGIVSFGI